ncbi:MAG: hypothetical protein WC756_17725 [Taibaiella sp.]|jgi:hypothetical protein
MPTTNYVNIKIDNQILDLNDLESVPISIDYELENEDNFQQKRASQTLDLPVPATTNNDRIFGSYHDLNVESDKVKYAKNIVIEANGLELFKGKTLVSSATSQFGKPKEYKLDCFGNNGDWIIPFQDKTLQDFVSAHTHNITQAKVFESWYFDGQSEVLDFTYAPVRYRQPFADSDSRVYYAAPAGNINILDHLARL